MPQPLIGRDATSDLGVSLNTDAKSLNNAVSLVAPAPRPRRVRDAGAVVSASSASASAAATSAIPSPRTTPRR